jgi:hypothetical protein
MNITTGQWFADEHREVVETMIHNQSEMRNWDFSAKATEIVETMYNPKSFVGFDLFSIIPMTSQFDDVLFLDNKQKITHKVGAKTSNLTSIINGLSDAHEIVAFEMTNKINSLMLNAVMKNCMNIMVARKDIHKNLLHAVKRVALSCKRHVNDNEIWVCCGAEEARDTFRVPANGGWDIERFDCNIGSYKCRLITAPLMHCNKFVVGYKRKHYNTSYVYLPYVPFTATPDNENDRTCFLHRYGQTMFRTTSYCVVHCDPHLESPSPMEEE